MAQPGPGHHDHLRGRRDLLSVDGVVDVVNQTSPASQPA
jgi:hypothetical protein